MGGVVTWPDSHEALTAADAEHAPEVIDGDYHAGAVLLRLV
jgi:hypothetical protein